MLSIIVTDNALVVDAPNNIISLSVMGSFFNKLRRAVDRFYLTKIKRCSSDFYYFALSARFSREHAAVLSGKRQHLRSAHRIDPLRFRLRRNIHRLEKALIMRPRRSKFALSYIEETIRAFEMVSSVDCRDVSRTMELKWFRDVIEDYFASIEVDVATAGLRERFTVVTKNLPAIGSGRSAPYPRELGERSDIKYDQFYQLCKQRRSTRWFLPDPVPRDLLDKAVQAALQSPSACNRQPFEYRIIDDPKICLEAASIPMGTGGYAANIRVLVVVVGKLDAYFDERDRHLIYIDGSLSAMTFMLALETLGLASCPINWPDIEDRERRMENLLGLEPWERPVLLVAVGFPDPKGGIPYSEKSPLDAMRRYN